MEAIECANAMRDGDPVEGCTNHEDGIGISGIIIEVKMVGPDEVAAMVRETNGNYDLWMQDIDGSELVQLTSSKYGDFEPAWSPDGKQLLFISNRDAEGDVRKTSVYTLELASNSIRRLTNAKRATDGSPVWFDEHTAVFHSNRSLKEPQKDTQTGWNIWQVKLNKGK